MTMSGSYGQDDADPTLRNRFLLPERPAYLDEHVEGKREKRASDKAVHTALASLDSLGVGSPRLDAEPPEERGRRRTLDKAIETKTDKGNTSCL